VKPPGSLVDMSIPTTEILRQYEGKTFTFTGKEENLMH
jgi:hypothetical protein